MPHFTSPLSSPLKTSAAIALMAASAHGATLVNNGDFENWPSANPSGWGLTSNATATKSTGLGGGNAALIGVSSANTDAHLKGTLTSTVATQGSFNFSIDFLQPTMTAGTDRGFNVTLRSSGDTVLNFAVIGNQLNSTQTSGGTATFAPVSSTALTADTWYRLVVTGDGGRYTLELFDLSSGSSTALITAANQNRWQTYPTSSLSFSEIRLERGRSAVDWVADNVTMIPEPSAAALASAGLLGLAFRRKRRA